ncbi:MAG: SDR family oxidoreductase [Leptolyngbyaceae cyanobacterium bins.59]|nr:SDR family oxidoreductase [Leptolyngbyaceae cyanobacterium bins.59]
MKVAIIGAGYVGAAVARSWHDQGLTVTVTTTRSQRVAELESIAQRVQVIRGEDADALGFVLQDQEVVLLSLGAPRADAYEETYLRTAKTLAQILPRLPNLHQIIYTGSYAVYGDRQGNFVDENTPPQPANCNGEILAETEQVLLSAVTDTRTVCIFRLGGIYGPGRELVRIFGRAAGTTRPGSGAEPSNWIHLEDIVGAIDFARTHALSGLYNLVQDNPPPVRELIDRVFAQHQLAPVVWDASQPSVRPYNAKVSNEKLKTAGYQFRHTTIEV